MAIATVYASSVAKLDSNVRTGGGTDDTAALQAVLNRAKTEGGIHLIMDGAALISQLIVYSNTTIECLQVADIEAEMARLAEAQEKSIAQLGTVQSVKDLAGKLLGLVDPDTVIFLPEQ